MGDGQVRFGAEIKTTYPPRGDLQQYRLEASTTFTCARCRERKVAKLVATSAGAPDEVICNGCYGRLVSNSTAQRAPEDSEPKADDALPDIAPDALNGKSDLLHIADDHELGLHHGLSISDRGVEWAFQLRQENLVSEWCPIPPFMASKSSGRVLELSIWRTGNTSRPMGDRQSVRSDMGDDHCRLANVTWPVDVLPGTRVTARWDRWKNVRFSLTPLIPPVVVEGRLVRYEYDPRIMTRDSVLWDSSGRDVKGVLLLTVQRLGLLDHLGRAMLPEAALLRNAAAHSTTPLPPEHTLRTAIKLLIQRGDLTVERGSSSVGGYLRHPARPGEHEVELLCYTPQRRKAEQEDLRRAEATGQYSVRPHDVTGHLMYIRHLGREASEEARAAYRKDHSEAGLVGPHEIPQGYTYVRPHRRGR
ncbi:hypothetical protein [Streptomyces adustus]